MQTNQSLSILLVDDDEALLETVADMLAIKDGLGVQTARDGQEALALLQHFQPDLTLVDIRMPGMNGWELVRAMRARSGTQKIVMLTGSHAEDDIRSAFERGVDGYLLKPVRANLLYALIDNIANNVPLEQQFTAGRWGNE
ncbi:MAG: response regulator [Chitinivorax sp.]